MIVYYQINSINGSKSSNQDGLSLKIPKRQNENPVRLSLKNNFFDHFLGLLKIEEEIDQGSLVALSPKCYNLTGSSMVPINDGQSKEVFKVKRALKGIHRDSKLEEQDFLGCLYENDQVLRDQYSFRIRNDSKNIDLIKNKKIALNNTYYKMRVHTDRVTCTPLTKENKYV